MARSCSCRTRCSAAGTVMRGYVSTTAGQVHYRRAGDKGPWLFLFHQSPFSSVQFERCLPLLGRFCRAVAFDTPGYGESDVARQPHGLRDYAVVLTEAIDSLGARDMVLAGFHTGAGIALEAAALVDPARLRGVILTGVPRLSPERMARLLTTEIPPPRMQDDGAHLLAEWASRHGNWGGAGGIDQVHAAVVAALAVYPRYRWGFEALQRHDAAALLRRLTCPTLFITSDRDSVRLEDAGSARLCPQTRVVNLGDVPPQIPWTAPDAYAEAIRRFIDGLQSSGPSNGIA